MKISAFWKILLTVLLVIVLGGGAAVYSHSQTDSAGGPTSTDKKTNTTNKKVAVTKMDLQAIKKGDFSSVAGTWQKPNGDTLVFDNKGLVSSTYDGKTTTDVKLFGDVNQQGMSAAAVKDGVLKTYIGSKTGPNDGPSALVTTDFIPRNVSDMSISAKSVDQIYSGQQLSDDNVFTRVDPASQKLVSSLSEQDKETLALLGMPSGFKSDYGVTSVDDILAGKANPIQLDGSGNFNQTTTTFHGIKFEKRDGKYILHWQNVPSDVTDRDEVLGYFQLTGDTVQYGFLGARTTGPNNDTQLAQPLSGNQSLSKLYQQYHGTDKFKKIHALIEN